MSRADVAESCLAQAAEDGVCPDGREALHRRGEERVRSWDGGGGGAGGGAGSKGPRGRPFLGRLLGRLGEEKTETVPMS